MTDAATISAGLQSLKAAFDIGKALTNLSISAEIKSRIIEMNGKILAAQESAIASRDYQSALLKQIGDLEKHIAELEAWDAEKQKYELINIRDEKTTKNFGPAFARALKADAGTSEPSHLVCPDCYEKREKTILQEESRAGNIRVLFCQRCQFEISRTGPWEFDTSRWTPPRKRK